MIYLRSARIPVPPGRYPFNSPAICGAELEFTTPITFLVGENGCGKSTLLEAMARAMRLPAIGSQDAYNDATLAPIEPLAKALRLIFTKKPLKGFFLRAEDFFGFLRRVEGLQKDLREDLERIDDQYRNASAFTRGQARMAAAGSLRALDDAYGQTPDAQSHGESFISLFHQRITPGGFYLLDEPEAPLSPLRQLALISLLKERENDSQFIIATHSPILMSTPGARIYDLDQSPARQAAYDDLPHVVLLRDFLRNPQRFLDALSDE